MDPETSIIIRTKNEEKWIAATLEKLYEQSYKNFEIIIIDSGSKDRTLEICKKFPVHIFEILPEKFSYPGALNYGIRNSIGTTYIVILSAHSIPISNTWLEDGILNFTKFNDISVTGVYGPLKALPDATIWDKILQTSSYILWQLLHWKNPTVINKPSVGVLGFTNAVIRKELWEKRNFDEKYGAGGEDQEWATYWLNHGYKAIKDIKFTVYYSHYLNLIGWYKQYHHWRSTAEPKPFQPLSYRKDGPHQN